MKTGSFLAALGCALGVVAMPSPADAQNPATPGWYRGNTHTHTSNSRGGDSAPDAVARWYREHGYQFVFITDHDQVLTDVAPLNALLGRRDWFLVLPGQEMGERLLREGDKPGDLHINSLFATKVIWPDRAGATLTRAIAPVLEQGALVQVNHPNYGWSLKPADLDDLPDGAFLEIWNGLPGINNIGGADGKGEVKPASEGFWDHLLSRGKIVWATGADDIHVLKTESPGAGKAWIMVRAAELTPAAIRRAMEAGDFYASTGVTLSDIAADAESLTITIPETGPKAGPRYTTRFIGQDGKLLAEVAGLKPAYRFKGGETYVRARITDSDGRHAWTQPVFRDGRAGRVRR